MSLIKWVYKPSGWCPVQAEGFFMGEYFYFRSRGTIARIEFAKNEKDWEDGKYTYSKNLYRTKEKYAAGYLKSRLCMLLIYKGCFLRLLKRIL